MGQNPLKYPKVRPLMVFPIAAQNGESICLRDPEGFSDSTLVINHSTYLMISLMDGTRDIKVIQDDFMRHTKVLIPLDQIEGLIDRLREALFMDDPRFHDHLTKTNETFLNARVRPAAHSGTAYPEGPDELSPFLQGFYKTLRETKTMDDSLSGIIVPHIDIRQGGSCYAAAYNVLRTSTATTFIILGTAHSNIGNVRYAICPKDFETPLGIVSCDREGIKSIQDTTGIDWTAGQLGHRTEHSVEFQALFLRHLFPEREIRIIPVLCNTLADLMDSQQGPMMDDDSIRNFIEAIQAMMRKRKGEVVLIAGADLSHIGPKFGHTDPVTETDLKALRSHDLALIKQAEEGDAEGFFGEIQKERDSHNVCGFPNIYTFLKVLEGKKGTLVDYGQFYEPPTASAVSYASLVF